MKLNRLLFTSVCILSATICSAGRTQTQFDAEGTGTALSFQVGTTPSSLIRIPSAQTDVPAPFKEGKCFVAMGEKYTCFCLHIFYDDWCK